MSFYHWGFALLGALLCAAVMVWPRRARARSAAHQVRAARAAIHSCNVLLELMAQIQQHRGMSSALLAGDTRFAPALSSKRSSIAPLIEQLQQLAEAENKHRPPCFTPAEVAAWRQRWNNVVAELEGSSLEKAIVAHSNLIATLLNWLGALGEERIEVCMTSSAATGMVLNYSQRLPQLAETLGQARATGSGVAALGTCSAVARVRLMFLISRAESLLEQACAIDPNGSEAMHSVQALALMIRRQMLSSQQLHVSADAYYRTTSQAIDAVFRWLHASGHLLEKQLGQAWETPPAPLHSGPHALFNSRD